MIESRVPMLAVLEECGPGPNLTLCINVYLLGVMLNVCLQLSPVAHVELKPIEPQNPLERVPQPIPQLLARPEGVENFFVDNGCGVIEDGSLWQGEKHLDVVVAIF